ADRLALTGPSGCGKSTLLDALALIAFPDQLEHYVLGSPDGPAVSVTELLRAGNNNALAAIRCRYIGYVLQTGGLLPFLSVERNILLPSTLRGPTDRPASQTVQSIVQRLGLERHLHKLPAELSVGERQRVAVARAVVAHPPIVLADEPTAALDPHTAREVMALLLDLTHDAGITLVIASHDHALLDAFDMPRTSPVLTPAQDEMTATFCYGDPGQPQRV
ncbi:ABC transporter ATP-binding protein, partial [Candidatus Entotheonella palauensis]|uniref:ABC transporter ATP-binding protein n=1 Tax=Candidatus Entotheonella palauensis TaxID=93172 RepID=UPI000B7D79A3